MNTPRFTIKTIFGCVVVVSLPLAVAAAGEPLGLILLAPVAGGCGGYLVNGGDGACIGVFVGALILLAMAMAMRPF